MRNEQLTLVIITPGFPKDETDSNCLPTQQLLIKSINKLYPGLRIIILTLDYPFSNTSYQWNGNAVISFNAWKKPRFKKMFILFAVLRTLNRLRRRHNLIGIVSFWCGVAAMLGHRFAKRHGLKHYCWILGQDAKMENSYVKKIQPAAEELMAISTFVQKEFEKNHRIRPAHIVPNGIDPDTFSSAAVNKDIDVLAAGSLIPLKQYDIFVDVISDLKRHFPNIKSILCGKGPEESSLKQLVVEQQLGDHLELCGEIPHEDLLKQMKRTRLFLHTSNYEGFSTVCLEALYAGASVISFCGPGGEAIDRWHIVRTKEGMLQKAIEILNDPPQSSGIVPYSIHDSAKKMISLLNYSE